MKKLVGIIALLLALVFVLTACGKEEKPSSSDKAGQEPSSLPKIETPSVENESGISLSEYQPATDATDAADTADADILEGTWIISGVKADNPDDAELRYIEMMDELISSGDFAETFTFSNGMMIHTVKNRDSEGQWITTAEHSAPYSIDGNKITTTNAMGREGSIEFKVTENTLELFNKDDITVLTKVE